MTTTYQTGHTDYIDFLGQMIADHLDDESVPMAITTFCRDYPDSQTSEDFAYWLDGLSPKEASIRLADNQDDLRAWIADDDIEVFRRYASDEYGYPLPEPARGADDGHNPGCSCGSPECPESGLKATHDVD